MHIERFSTGRISHYLKPVRIISGKYAIATANLYPSNFVVNINFPFFDSKEAAISFLETNFEREE